MLYNIKLYLAFSVAFVDTIFINLMRMDWYGGKYDGGWSGFQCLSTQLSKSYLFYVDN